VLEAEWGGTACPCSSIPESARLEGVDYRALTLEIERSRPPGSGVATFQRVGLGPAWIKAERFPGIDFVNGGFLPGPWVTHATGFAVSGTLGLRLMRPPGPVGVLVALRSSNVFAKDHRIHVLLFSLGLTIHPMGPRQAAVR